MDATGLMFQGHEGPADQPENRWPTNDMVLPNAHNHGDRINFGSKQTLRGSSAEITTIFNVLKDMPL